MLWHSSRLLFTMAAVMIRPLEPNDILKLVSLGKEMHQAGHFKDTEYCEKKVINLLMSVLDNDYQCCCVSVVNGEIIGMFIGFITTYYFGNTLTSNDYLLFVSEKHRGGSSGIKMLHYYIKWAESAGVTRRNIRLGNSAEIATDAVDRLYKHVGFRSHGTLYVLGD